MARELPTANLPTGDFRLRYPLSKSERVFYDALNQALGKYCVIFPKVRLCDIIRNTSFGDFNRICSKHVDFLVCYKDTLKPNKVVELDDWSHTSPVNRAHDMVKEFYLNRAGIPVLRYPTYRTYHIDPLLKAFKQKAADTNIAYPVFPVDVEVEEVYAFSEPDTPESELIADEEPVIASPAADKPITEVRHTATTVTAKKYPMKKHGIMERLIFLFSGELKE